MLELAVAVAAGGLNPAWCQEKARQERVMSYDALVWLLVGLGVGVAGSLMLLLGYVTLEHRRLGRRDAHRRRRLLGCL